MKIDRKGVIEHCIFQLKLQGLAWDATSVNRRFIDCLVEGICHHVELAFCEYTTTLLDPSSSVSAEVLERAVLLVGKRAVEKENAAECHHSTAFSCQNCHSACCWVCKAPLSGPIEIKTIANKFCLHPECRSAEKEAYG